MEKVKYHMNNKYGFREELNPKSAFKEIDLSFSIENIDLPNGKNDILVDEFYSKVVQKVFE